MKRKLLVGTLLVGMMAASVGCQQVAKRFGGSITVDLPKDEKLVNVTWKNDSLWYLTRPMTKSDKEETYKFKEDSNFGVLEGTVIVKEHKEGK
ncbi:putative membrane lipoprotein [Bacillus phage vB_BmeM-Goe8]|uniref:Putative membrane lipoprotein n=1 Tax=Bacillus phage vB_BmeM-Goe8 TaxID=2593638 RepID=A0A516KMW1_9CAUD|nr:putative membrane lipoprotein [Bacillus phage vB_BmeM-Goe8]QDP42920.1 putative membrane lipoprotein [Bacillus phage vB_BmeM-Goe8]